MKMAPLMRAWAAHPNVEPVLVHTGQHSDPAMSDIHFLDLGLRQPDVNLGISGGSHAEQHSGVMIAFERFLGECKPDLVVVVGDVNSTVSCALVAAKLGVRVAHVEAGLRSFERNMPEEINRILTDQVSDYLFVSEKSALFNLEREGIKHNGVQFAGSVIIDSLDFVRPRVRDSDILRRIGVDKRGYAVLTLHRASNVDDDVTLEQILASMERIACHLPVLYVSHPRTQKRIAELNGGRPRRLAGVTMVPPLGYIDFIKLVSDSRVVFTDSGGIQEESTVLGVPCITLRDSTERPCTIESGTNRLAGTAPERIFQVFDAAMRQSCGVVQRPPNWDGRAAERITAFLARQPASPRPNSLDQLEHKLILVANCEEVQ
jgi:UDP-N-acetylglucosamine 2-epimerase (non-hydrolysing)